MRASTILGLTSFFLASISAGVASAEETAPAKPAAGAQRKVVVINVDVTGHRPVVPSVDVGRLVMRAPLPVLRKPLVDPTGAALDRDPF